MSAKPVLHPLGKNGPLVPSLGTGLMGFSHTVYGDIQSDEERFKFLDRALEIGATFWDTADLYADGEEVIGKWFKRTGKRDKIFLASKFGYVKGSKTLEADTSYEYTKKATANSLAALGVESIDLYYVHQANPNTPIEETMRALKELQDEGKIKHIGLSTVSSTTLRRAHKIAPVTAVQTEYSVFNRAIEGPAGTDLLAVARELGVAIVVAMPLGRGLLTADFGKNDTKFEGADIRPKLLPHFKEDNIKQNIEYVAKFRVLADRKGCTVSQLALAWLLKQGDDIFPIPGTKQIKYLEQNWAALDVVLTDDEDREIRAFGDQHKVAGGSVPPGMESFLFRDTKEEGA